jgi:hypothetical protein
MIEHGDLDPTIILTHRFPLDDMAALYPKFDAKEGGIMKPFVETKFSSPAALGTPKLMRVSEL